MINVTETAYPPTSAIGRVSEPHSSARLRGASVSEALGEFQVATGQRLPESASFVSRRGNAMLIGLLDIGQSLIFCAIRSAA